MKKYAIGYPANGDSFGIVMGRAVKYADTMTEARRIAYRFAYNLSRTHNYIEAVIITKTTTNECCGIVYYTDSEYDDDYRPGTKIYYISRWKTDRNILYQIDKDGSIKKY